MVSLMPEFLISWRSLRPRHQDQTVPFGGCGAVQRRQRVGQHLVALRRAEDGHAHQFVVDAADHSVPQFRQPTTDNLEWASGCAGVGGRGGSAPEFCGPTFTSDGKVLFVNMQDPGLTLAITGPWQKYLG